MQGTLALRRLSLIVSSLVVLGSGRCVPNSFADSQQMEDRDRALDWALGGLEQGSRITRPTGERAPAGTGIAPGSKVSPADTGTSRASRETAGAVLGVRSASPSGTGSSGAGAGGPSGVGTSQPPSSGGQTQVGGGGGEQGTGTGGTGGTGETTPGGETTEGGLGIHVETETSGGDLNAGVQVETPETSLEAGTGVEAGTETAGTGLGGQLDVEAGTETSGTDLVGSADLTGPAEIDTTTTTELDSNLTGGGNDASVDSDAEEEAIGDDADDCALLGLISCPSFP